MLFEFSYYNYLKLNKGAGILCCHADAVHAAPPQADRYTDLIVMDIMAHTRCAGIISTVSRTKADLNRSPDGGNDEALREYRNSIKEILNHLAILDHETNQLTKPYLHLAIHGMKDVHYGPHAVEIGTLQGKSCSLEIRDWLNDLLMRKAHSICPEIEIVFDRKFIGNSSLLAHRIGDGKNYLGYGPNFNTFQIEIANTLRKKYLFKIIDILTLVIVNFQETFVTRTYGPK